MYKYQFVIETDLAGCTMETEMEYDAEPTEKELEEDLKDFVNDHIGYYYERIE